MIRQLRKADINKVADIWLDTNIKTHYFIPAQYWKSNFELVKELLLQATVYVYEDKQGIQGFIGLSDEYIEGIFVSAEMQSRGIGKILLNYAKEKRNKLLLNVYQKNTRAIAFYQREGFEIQGNGVDEATGERDYVMAWHSHSLFPDVVQRRKLHPLHGFYQNYGPLPISPLRYALIAVDFFCALWYGEGNNRGDELLCGLCLRCCPRCLLRSRRYWRRSASTGSIQISQPR